MDSLRIDNTIYLHLFIASNGTDNIIIFSFINPATVAFVGNYQLIMNNINVLVSQFFNGTNASVGNLVAENDIKNMMKVFWEMMALRFFLAGCACVLLYVGFDNLIILWLGEKYLMSHSILLALIAVFFILQVRQPVDSFKQAYGLYGDIWAPIAQSIINLVFSIILVIKFGVIGVFFGTIISQIIIVLIWRPYYLFTNGFKIGNGAYWLGFCAHIFYLSLAGALFYFLIDYIDFESNTSLISLIFKLIKVGVIFSSIYFLILLGLSKGFKNLIDRFIKLIRKKLNK